MSELKQIEELTQEITRLRAENERVKRLLDTVFSKYCGTMPDELASVIVKALGADK